MAFTSCPPSAAVRGASADHLLAAPRPAGVAERVLLVGRDEALASDLARAGLGVVFVTPEELASRFRIEAAPLLVVSDPRDTVRYAGGYTDRKQSLAVRDLELIAAARAGRARDPLPLYGCAVSASLRSTVNPLGL